MQERPRFSTFSPSAPEDSPIQFRGQSATVEGLQVLLDADGRPIEWPTPHHDQCLLAYAANTVSLVEFRVFHSAAATPEKVAQQLERLTALSQVKTRSLPRIRQHGYSDGLLHMTCDLVRGEPLDDYLARHGALSPTRAFRLIIRLLDDLVYWQDSAVGISRMSLNDLWIAAEGGAQLALKIRDIGLHRQSLAAGENYPLQLLSRQICRTLLRLLTGKAETSLSTRNFPALTCLTTPLRVALRDSLDSTEIAGLTLIQLRYELIEAQRVMSKTQALERHPAMPRSPLEGRVLPRSRDFAIRVKERLGQSLTTLENGMPALLTAPSNHAVPVDLIALPSNSLCQDDPEMVRLIQSLPLREQACLLRPLIRVEEPDHTWLVEEYPSGLGLTELLAQRQHLSAEEAVLLLEHLASHLEDLRAHGIHHEPHPAKLHLTHSMNAENGDDPDSLLLTRWRGFSVRLRLHSNPDALLMPPLVPHHLTSASHTSPVEKMHRAFISLAAWMLTGEWPDQTPLIFPNSHPSPLVAYVKKHVAACVEPAPVVSMDAFVDGLRQKAPYQKTHLFEDAPPAISPNYVWARTLRRTSGSPSETTRLIRQPKVV
jgi:hypothetical protein